MTTNGTAANGALLAHDGTAITDKTICLAINRGRFGARRKASTAAMSIESDKTLLSLSKNIIDSPEMSAVRSIDGEITKFIR